MSARGAMPVQQVRDAAAAEACCARLGFAFHGAWGDPPAFGIAQRGDVTRARDRDEGLAPIRQGRAASRCVDDAAALAEGFADEGVQIATPVLADGLRDFDVIDPDGRRLCFGSDMSPAPRGPGPQADLGRG